MKREKENVQYSKNIQSFLEKYNILKESFRTYSDELDEFTEVINTLANGDSDATKNYNSGNGIIINNNVLLSTNDLTGSLDDLSMNNISGNDVYYDSSLKASSYIVNQPNIGSIMQQDISDIMVLNDHNTKYGTWKSINPSDSPIDLLASSAKCSGNVELLEQCSGYAKMTNKSYFGITEVTDSDDTTKCQCYVFDLIDNLPGPKSLIISSPATDDKLQRIAYFGVLLDGNLYSLKAKVFQNNYDNFFKLNNNMQKINTETPGMANANCHPYTGSGPHSLSITKIDKCS